MAKNRPARGDRNAPAAPSRLPSTRERRPALAALAVLLIVGGALASGWLALRAGDRVEYLQVSREVAQGARIGADDLEEVRLPRGFEGVPSGQRDQVAKLYASTRLLPGTVLRTSMLTENGGVPEGTAEVFVGVSAAEARGMTSGSAVALTAEDPEGGAAQTVLGEVVSTPDLDEDGGIGGSDSDLFVRVSIGARCLATVSAAAAQDAVQVALVGPGSTGLADACRRD